MLIRPWPHAPAKLGKLTTISPDVKNLLGDKPTGAKPFQRRQNFGDTETSPQAIADSASNFRPHLPPHEYQDQLESGVHAATRV